MKDEINRIWVYIKLLFKKWVSWLIIAGGLVGIFVTFRLLKKEIPFWAFWVLVIAGLFWAGYKVFKEQLLKLPINKRGIEPKSDISIRFIEGNEYTYSLSKGSTFRESRIENGDVYVIPDAFVEQHLRIKNNGETELDIISIVSQHMDSGYTFDFLVEEVKKRKFNYPKRLVIDEILLCTIKNESSVTSTTNNAQIAVKLGEMNNESSNFSFEIIVEARDLKGGIHEFIFPAKLAIQPLVELYINKFQEDKQLDLLRLISPDF